MKPITIKSNEQCLMFDKQRKHAEITITQDCNIKSQIFDYFLDLIPSIVSLKISIKEQSTKNREQQNQFLSLRDSLLTKITTELKSLNTISISYTAQNIDSTGIKKIVQFIESAQNSTKRVDDCNINIQYSQSLINFSGILEAISTSYLSIAGSITHFSISFINDLARENLLSLSPLFIKLKNVKNFVFRASTSLNLKTEELQAQFIQSMKPIIQSTRHFEFDMSEASFQHNAISSITENISLLISSGSEELESVIVNLEKVGWTFDRQKLIKGNFVYGIAQSMHRWPKSIRNLRVNLDRALSYNENIIDNHLTLLLEGCSKIMPQLEYFGLNLNGIGFSMNNLKTNTFNNRLISLFENANKDKLRSIDLKLSGHLQMTFDQWTHLFNSITSLNSLESLILDIERWKNFKNDFTTDNQFILINTFLSNLYKNHNSSLRKFHFNMDDWKYLHAYSNEYAQILMKFSYVEDLKVLWYKSQHTSSLKNLDLVQSMSAQIQRDIVKSVLIKKLGIQINEKAAHELEELEEESLKKEINYFFILNRRSPNSFQFLNQ